MDVEAEDARRALQAVVQRRVTRKTSIGRGLRQVVWRKAFRSTSSGAGLPHLSQPMLPLRKSSCHPGERRDDKPGNVER